MTSAVTTKSVALRRRLKSVERDVHGLWQILKALVSTDHPLLAHLIPMRRCNLACTYCNEFDNFSEPVPADRMLRRVDLLGDLGTSVITISGGEPLLHPQLDDIIRHMRKRRIVSGLITNGYLLTADRIQRLNRSGLEWLQISIDNVIPDEVSKKSLKVLDRKLRTAGRTCGFSREYQFGGGRRSEPSAGRAHHRQARVGVGIQLNHRNHSRRLGTGAALERRRAARVSRDEGTGETQLHARECVSGQHRAGASESVALPRRSALPLYLRGRAGALLLAAARVSGAFRWRNTRLAICAASSSRRSGARRIARYRACTRYRCWMHGALRNGRHGLRSRLSGLVQIE